MHPYRRLRMVMASAPGTSACAACRVLRRKCTAQCLFAPYFPPDQPQKFAHVHKVFGVANVTKMLHELPPPHREDCVNSLAYEADARVQDPVYGCVGAISVLQQQTTRQRARTSLISASAVLSLAVRLQFKWPDEKNPLSEGNVTSIVPSFSGCSWLKVVLFYFLHATAFTCFSCKNKPLVAHLQTQLALATSEIARLRETFTIAAAASTTNSSPPASNINGPSNGGPPVFLTSLQPLRSPSQAPDNSLSVDLDHPAPPSIEPRHEESPEPPRKQPSAAACETSRPASS